MARASAKSPEAFRTISEAADVLDLPQHVLRFWETRFSQIKPMKRSGGRRYYRPSDIALLQGIRHLLYDEGYTIKGRATHLARTGHRPRGEFRRSDRCWTTSQSAGRTTGSSAATCRSNNRTRT
jgi:DNA-binding transcriptional MerR regulator